MRLTNYLKEGNIDENIILDTIKKIGNKPAGSVMKILKDGFTKFVGMFQQQDDMTQEKVLGAINKAYGTNYRNVDDLKSQIRANIKESTELNEKWSHYWDLIKGEAFPALSFYPALTAWLEIDKWIRQSGDVNSRVIVVYGLIWLLLISGKFVKGFRKWKKDNPEEYYSERPKKAAKLAAKEAKAAKAAKIKNKRKEVEKWDQDRQRKKAKGSWPGGPDRI